jgi:hypothetical protein
MVTKTSAPHPSLTESQGESLVLQRGDEADTIGTNPLAVT